MQGSPTTLSTELNQTITSPSARSGDVDEYRVEITFGQMVELEEDIQELKVTGEATRTIYTAGVQSSVDYGLCVVLTKSEGVLAGDWPFVIGVFHLTMKLDVEVKDPDTGLSLHTSDLAEQMPNIRYTSVFLVHICSPQPTIGFPNIPHTNAKGQVSVVIPTKQDAFRTTIGVFCQLCPSQGPNSFCKPSRLTFPHKFPNIIIIIILRPHEPLRPRRWNWPRRICMDIC